MSTLQERGEKTIESANVDERGDGYGTDLSEPSLKRVPQFQGTMSPVFVLFISTTGFKIPGTAAEATEEDRAAVSVVRMLSPEGDGGLLMAVQIRQSGAVRYWRARELRIVRESRSD